MTLPRRDEDGFVMVLSVILLTVVASLGAIVMTTSNHTTQSSGRGRSWVQALHVAESGLQETLVRLEATGGSYAGTFTGDTDEGSYTVTVTPLARSRYLVDSWGTVGTVSSLQATRHVQVRLAPPISFEAALFSYTSIDTKNNDNIVGDIWANQNVIVDANDVIEGSVTAATGFVHMRTWSRVKGSVTSGGYNSSSTNGIFLDQNARVDGNATAAVTAPTNPINCGGESQNNYTIRLNSGALVQGSTKTWGSKQGPGTVGGSVVDHVCESAPAARPLPVFQYNPDNYDPATLHEYGTPAAPSATAVTEFQAMLDAGTKNAMSGTYVVWKDGEVGQHTRIDLTGVKIAGDTTIVTNVPIFSNGTTDLSSVSDAILVLASFYRPPTGTVCDVNLDASECAVHVKNEFQTSGATACLVYAPNGPVAIKNNQIMFGAVYADNIQIKNNQSLTYDSRIDRIVGFGPVTLEQTEWKELPA